LHFLAFSLSSLSTCGLTAINPSRFMHVAVSIIPTCWAGHSAAFARLSATSHQHKMGMRHRTARLLKSLADGLRPAADPRAPELVRAHRLRHVRWFSRVVNNTSAVRARSGARRRSLTVRGSFFPNIIDPWPLWPEPCCIDRHASDGNGVFSTAGRAARGC
jgi:hypothetical protein